MQLLNANLNEVKAWIVKRLDNISDADPEVLADYVLALLTSDEPEDSVRRSCLENLEDFLKENTRVFVDEIFQKYGSKPAPPAHLPARPPSSTRWANTSNPFPSIRALALNNGQTDISKSRKTGRKRSYDEQNGRQYVRSSLSGDKSSRINKSRRQDRKGRRLHGQAHSMQYQPNPMMLPPQAFPGFPVFDPNDSMAAMMAMQAFMQTFGMPGMGQRCNDYDTKGYCTRGAACPFQHGEDKIVAPGGSAFGSTNSLLNLRNGSPRIRGDVGQGTGFKNLHGYHSNDSSDARPNYDTSITTIVVERIPADNLDEEQVRQFFSQYGKIDEVNMQPARQRALVKYASYKAAKRAYDSPKVVFDNRFVKVYWYKPKQEPNHSSLDAKADDEDAHAMDLDPEIFARQQETAQKNYEERMAKLKANAEARRQLYEEQQRWKEKNEAEMKELLARIAAAEAKRPDTEGSADLDNPGGSLDAKSLEKAKVQKALREQLALLEAEAKSLGIDPDAPPTPSYRTSSFSPFSSSRRASHRGARGRFHHLLARNHSGGVLRLDNRPKRLAVSLPTGSSFDADKDEALRQYLVGVSEFESIEQDPDQASGQGMIVSYAHRYQAEMLVARGKEIPGLGQVELKWVANTTGKDKDGSVGSLSRDTSSSSVILPETKRRSGRGDEDEDMTDNADDEDGELQITHEVEARHNNGRTGYSTAVGGSAPVEVNYDVASDDEVS